MLQAGVTADSIEEVKEDIAFKGVIANHIPRGFADCGNRSQPISARQFLFGGKISEEDHFKRSAVAFELAFFQSTKGHGAVHKDVIVGRSEKVLFPCRWSVAGSEIPAPGKLDLQAMGKFQGVLGVKEGTRTTKMEGRNALTRIFIGDAQFVSNGETRDTPDIHFPSAGIQGGDVALFAPAVGGREVGESVLVVEIPIGTGAPEGHAQDDAFAVLQWRQNHFQMHGIPGIFGGHRPGNLVQIKWGLGLGYRGEQKRGKQRQGEGKFHGACANRGRQG